MTEFPLILLDATPHVRLLSLDTTRNLMHLIRLPR